MIRNALRSPAGNQSLWSASEWMSAGGVEERTTTNKTWEQLSGGDQLRFERRPEG